MTVRIGTLDKRVEIRSVDPTTPDGAGGFTESTTLVKRTWAKIRKLSGRESAVSSQTQSVLSHRLVIRSGGASVTPQMYVIITSTSERLEIQSVAPHQGSRRYLELDCVEAVRTS